MPRALKGMVLAAGLGSRLRPLTNTYPKPLVPFAGSTPLELALANLQRAGIDDIAINAHYHADQIQRLVQQNPLGQRLYLSHEVELLGTGGAYAPVSAWAGDADLVVLNGDVAADFDLQALITQHRAVDAAATMMVLPAVVAGQSSVFHQQGQVLAIGKVAPPGPVTAGNFACAQILSPRLRQLLPAQGICDIISAGYQPALQLGWRVATSLHTGYWHDLGTPESYWTAILALLKEPELCAKLGLSALRHARGLPPLPNAQGVLTTAAHLENHDLKLGPYVVIEDEVHFGAGASVSHSVLLPGARVAAGATIDHAVVGAGWQVALGQAD